MSYLKNKLFANFMKYARGPHCCMTYFSLIASILSCAPSWDLWEKGCDLAGSQK